MSASSSLPRFGPSPETMERQLQASEDWQSVLRHFDLHEGFAFGLLLISNQGLLPVCRDDLRRHLRGLGKEMIVLKVETPVELIELSFSLPRNLPVIKDDVGVVWVSSAVVSEYEAAYPEWREAFHKAFARLNPMRNVLQQRFHTTLLFVCAPWAQSIIRNAAPDLWSVRSLVNTVEVAMPKLAELELPPLLSAKEFFPDPGLDPEMALRTAEALRGRPGQELQLATMLERAADGFVASGEYDRAVPLLKERLSILDAVDAPSRLSGLTNAALAVALLGIGSRSPEVLDEVRSHAQLAISSIDIKTEWETHVRALGCLVKTDLQLGNKGDALRHLEEAIRILDLHGQTLARLELEMDRGKILQELDDFASARRQFEGVLNERRSLLGDTDPATLVAMLRLGVAVASLGESSSARALFEKVLSSAHFKLDRNRRLIIIAAEMALAATLAAEGNHIEAKLLMEQVVQLCRTELGPEHPDTRLAEETLAYASELMEQQRESVQHPG